MRALPGTGSAWKEPTSAFTLIELLVVIAVIGILAALLLPALSGSKLKAHKVVCLSNLKQLGLASFTYHQDFGKGVPYRYNQAVLWGHYMAPQSTNYNSAIGGIRLCPAAREPTAKASDAGSFGGIRPIDNPGSAANCWSLAITMDPKEDATGSYALNGWFYSHSGLPKSEPEQWFPSYAAVQYPTKTPVFADAIWFDVWPGSQGGGATDLFAGASSDVAQYGRCANGGLTIARHGGKPPTSAPRNWPSGQPLPRNWGVNIAFADSHVESVKLADLWAFTWHRTWMSPSHHGRP